MCFPSLNVVFAILLLALSSFIFNAAGEEGQVMDQTDPPMSSSVPDMNATEGASMSIQMDMRTEQQGEDQSDGTTPSMDSSSMPETDSEMPMPTTPPSTQMDGSTEQPGEQGEDQSSSEATPNMQSDNITAETDSEFSTTVSTSSDGENETESTDETTVGSSLQCYTFSESDTLRKIDCRPIDTHCLTFRCNGTTIKDCAFPEDGPEEACKDSIKNCESENGDSNVDPHYCQYCTGTLCNNDEPNVGTTPNPSEEASDGTTPNSSEEASDGTTPNSPEEASDGTTPNPSEEARDGTTPNPPEEV